MQNLLIQIDSLNQQRHQLQPLSAAEVARLRQEFIIESTYNSNAIEGNSLTLRETALILNEGVTIAEKPLKDHLEAIGHKQAFEYLFEMVADNEPLSEKAIKDLHSLVLMNDNQNRGIYRKIPVRILGAENEPTAPHFIAEEMAQLINRYHTDRQNPHIHPLEAITRLHLTFETIHPFIDGNGRTGRLLLNFELMKAGYLPVDIKFTDRAKYYASFDDYHQTGGNPRALLALVADYELAELARYIEIVKGTKREQSECLTN